MDLALWIVAGLLAAVFGVAGLMKLTQRKETLAASGLAWTEDVSAATVKAIGGLEVLAALGLILPATFGIAPVLVPLAAAGLVLVMVGAAVTHARRKEHPAIAVNAVLLLLAAFVAWGRFGPHAF
ncbi:DoxX family protein [Nonomuraea sp. MCN248]|uniref:DoxX family protein n=1 Tax=Nonomuraea corallina TaxID=2989783 RepID=A0ABT4SNG0_9ACTN|nr:DoxX family protein [Nonomuraea corallina]MDA0638722.1 DoxX family protein [Nonomuraea corallina]